jgi:hypothetical protein
MMMSTIEVPDALFSRLQKLAIPLVDTPTTVIERVVNHYESCKETEVAILERAYGHVESWGQGKRGAAPEQQGDPRFKSQTFEPKSPPDLRHTRIISAGFAGRGADGWNRLVHVAHVEAMRRLGSVDALRRMSKSNMIVGRPMSEDEKKGYRYIAEINVSIQNVDAGHAWSNSLRLAEALNVELEVDFEWMPKNEAAYPGQMGRLSYKPQ